MLISNAHRTTLLLSPLYIDAKYMTNTSAGALRGSHNLTMTMLADHGIIGGTLFFLIIFGVIKVGISISRNKEYDRDSRLIIFGLTGGIIGLMAASQFSNSKVLEITIWIFALILVTAKIIANNMVVIERKE